MKKKWNYDSVKAVVSNYESRSEFQKKCGGAYKVARKNGWLDEWFEHLRKSWDYNSVKDEASKYNSRSEFKQGCKSAYTAARKNGWLGNFDWLVPPKRKIKWDYDSVKEVASKCKTRTEFQKIYGRAYVVALKNGWLDDFGWLKDARFDLFKDKIDCVYAYEFNELNSVYVGRTLMRLKKQRDREHIFREEDIVAIFARQNNIPIPKPKILEEYLTIEDGSKQEGYWLQRYIDNGWIVLNRTKTGSIGSLGKGKWNYESVKEEASKYKSRSEFKKGCGSAYTAARKNGWLNDFEWLVTPEREVKWNYGSVEDEASKYKTRNEFRKGCARAYIVALKNGWLDNWFGHIYKIWDYNSVKDEASKYKTRNEFAKRSASAYNVAKRNGWLDNWFGHIYKTWDYDSAKDEASKYKTRSEFVKGNRSAYKVAWKNGWLDDFFPKIK